MTKLDIGCCSTSSNTGSCVSSFFVRDVSGVVRRSLFLRLAQVRGCRSHVQQDQFTTMSDPTQCLLPKLPIIRRNYTIPTGEITLPAPCWTLGQMELVLVYFLVGLFIPLGSIFYVKFDKLKKLFLLYIVHSQCCKRKNDNDADSDPKAELAEELHVDQPAIDRLEALALAKAGRSKFSVFLAEAASPQTNLGQILMAIAIACSAVSLLIYLIAVSRRRASLEFCGTMPNLPQILDFFANLYLLFYFFIRLMGSDFKQKVVTSMFSIVDYFTIPSCVMDLVLNRYFTGFSFFRAYSFLWAVQLLQHRRIVRSINAIQLIKLIVLVMAIIIIGAGFLHMVENLGDPFLWDIDGAPLYNGQSVVFWRCFLYVYGRITMLDLSQMRMHTMLGRVIIYGFQILALGIIGQAIPQIMMRLKIKPDYDKDYLASPMFIHIVVCGYVTASTMEDFLKEFYHPDRGTSEFYKIVVLSENKPDEDMSTLTERYFNKLDYLRGTVMNMLDLNRVKLLDAKATLILTDRTAPDIDANDAANIMRVVSVKNYKDNAQVIVQLAQYHNKAYLQNIPSWNPEKGDIVICLAELRLGLLAQSCLAPGFSTLMANFFTTRSFDPKTTYKDPWMQSYVRGTSLELYCRGFSEAFIGMTFTQACEFCYRRLKIVLLAIHTHPEDPDCAPQINPLSSVIITGATMGYFIADDTAAVDRAQYYCAKCHLGVDDPVQIKQCNCERVSISYHLHNEKFLATVKKLASQTSRIASSVPLPPTVESKIWSYIRQYPTTPTQSMENLAKSHNDMTPLPSDIPDRPPSPSHLYDSTGMFYWTPARKISDVTINRKQAAMLTFHNHIVVCILSQPNSQIVGLASFILPLRSSVIPPTKLKDIIILGDIKFLEKEWIYLYNLPRLFVVKGTALNRSDLRAVNLNTCRMTVILGAPSANEKVTDPTMVDKSVILATLNVRAMKFSESESIFDEHGQYIKQDADDPSLPKNLPRLHRKSSSKMPVRRTGYEVPLITDLMRDSNVQFLDDEDDDLPGTEFYVTVPYIAGCAFASSVLDMLMITSFFNETIIKLIHTIVFGGASLELERIMAEGAGLIGGMNISKPAVNKDQVSVVQLPVATGPLAIHVGSPYGGLFIDALCSMGLVVLGLYRKIDENTTKRYVICNPPDTFEVIVSDEIFALQRANWEWQPPLRSASGSNSNHRRLVDADIRSLESKLQHINSDVAVMQYRYDDLLKSNNWGKGIDEVPMADDSNSPLLKVEPNHIDQESDLVLDQKKSMEIDLEVLEQKLANIKRDVAIMQDRYLQIVYNDQYMS